MKRITFIRSLGLPLLALLPYRVAQAVLPPPTLADINAGIAELTALQKRWALAVSGFWAEMNQRDHAVIGISQRTPALVQAGRQNLAKIWGIYNPHDLHRRLEYYAKQGASQAFNRIARELTGASPVKAAQMKAIAAGNPQLLHQIDLVERFFSALGPKSLVGFDLARYVSLCRAAYNADYLSEAQVWELVYPQAITIQKTFSGWMELGNNYILGTSFMSFNEYEKEKSFLEETLRNLTSHTGSPWVQLPWNLDLSRLSQGTLRTPQ